MVDRIYTEMPTQLLAGSRREVSEQTQSERRSRGSLRLLGDEQLAMLIAAGETEALEVVYDRHLPALVRYCQSILRVREDAEDAAQNAMLAAVRTLPGRPPRLKLRAWLFRVAHNEAISLLRRRRPHEPLEHAAEAVTLDVADAAATRARMEELVKDLHELPERQRSALLMRELYGLGYEEIASALGSGEHAAMQTVFEARTALMHHEQGRALSCSGIQRMLSDGDRRSLRARRVRAHIRGCDGCRAFEFAMSKRSRHFTLLLPLAAASGACAGPLGFFGLRLLRRPAAVTVRAGGAAGRARLHDIALRGLSLPSGIRGAGITILLAAGGGVGALHSDHHAHGTTSAAPVPSVAAMHAAASGDSRVATRAHLHNHFALPPTQRAPAHSESGRVVVSGASALPTVSLPQSAPAQTAPASQSSARPPDGLKVTSGGGRTDVTAGGIGVKLGAGSAGVQVGVGPAHAQLSAGRSGVQVNAALPASAIDVTVGNSSTPVTLRMSVSLLGR